MIRRLFVVVPSDSPDGPVKGAYALANALASKRDVTLVTLKKGQGSHCRLDESVGFRCLADTETSFTGKLQAFRDMLKKSGGRTGAASISMCLSADAINGLSSQYAVTCASVRGNLPVNYRMDYGALGGPLGLLHLMALRRFDRVVAMTEAMARQIRRYSGVTPAVVGNFVDEPTLVTFRRSIPSDGPIRFVFIGSLSTRKRPWLILAAMKELRSIGMDVIVDFVGTGPMASRLREEIERAGLSDRVRLWGFVESPYELLAEADAMVLPSLSEGLPRAALEALYLGVPCVLRDVDGNRELIADGENGALFSADSDLGQAMLRAGMLRRNCPEGFHEGLLPSPFRQDKAAAMYLDLVDSVQ